MSGSQKFISRNRAPRVQIEYDVEVYGAQKKVQLPFVMGVMSDLSGKSEVPKGSVADRKFLEIDIDNFDARMKAMKPRAAFSVPNTLTGEGNLSVDLVFEKMSDFSPAEIARKVEPLRKLLEARTQLENLMTYMDGKAGAEALIERLVAHPEQLRALALGAAAPDTQAAAFDAMKAAAPAAEVAPEDTRADVLAAMAAEAPEDTRKDTATEDTLAAMAALAEAPPEDDGAEDILAHIARAAPEAAPEDSGLDDLLADLAAEGFEDTPEDSPLEDALAGMAAVAEELLADDGSEDGGIDSLLADIAETAPEAETEGPELDDLLSGMAEDVRAQDAPDEAEESGLDDLLSGMVEAEPEGEPDDGVDALLADMAVPDEDVSEPDELDDLLAGMAGDVLAQDGPEDSPEDDGLDDLLAGLGESAVDETGEDDLDDLLAGMGALDKAPDEADDDVADLLAEVGGDDTAEDDGLDDLLGALDEGDDLIVDAPKKSAFSADFGSMGAAKLQFEPGARRKFRMAVLGDFSGRGNKGALETGAVLGGRKGFKLDFDTMEEVIARFRTTLTLPLGHDGSAVEVALNELDDLHPDELFENLELFTELNMLRRDLKTGRNFEQNVARMQAWGGAYGDFRALSKKRSKGADAPADLRLSDFQNLIGDSTPKPEASAASDLISRIIGPHIQAAADNGAEEMIAVVDKALSTAMSSVLHHPDFQTVEAAWRSIELLGRRVEASAELEVVVYDVSVEEFTADLAAQDDMSQSGLYELLVEKPMQDESAGPISAVIGLYTWEETPTHAELLARMARISAQMDAPFISAISTGFMGIKPEDRHPLVKKTWDALADMPEAKYLGLASPRFMLRMPYGKKTEPLDRFDYEEFNVKEGMRSLLMANPALLVAVLLAETKARQGGDMSLGSIMSLNDMPFHYMTDQYGDQVALPCTERLLSVSGAAEVVARGFMPVLSVQGQNIVKLGSFQAVGGGELLGIWAGAAAKDMKSGAAQMEASVGMSAAAPRKPAPAAEDAEDADLDSAFESDDLDLDLDLGDDDDLDLDLDLGDDGDDGMDDLLAGFGDDDEGEDGDMDADLAALLGDL